MFKKDVKLSAKISLQNLGMSNLIGEITDYPYDYHSSVYTKYDKVIMELLKSTKDKECDILKSGVYTFIISCLSRNPIYKPECIKFTKQYEEPREIFETQLKQNSQKAEQIKELLVCECELEEKGLTKELMGFWGCDQGDMKGLVSGHDSQAVEVAGAAASAAAAAAEG